MSLFMLNICTIYLYIQYISDYGCWELQTSALAQIGIKMVLHNHYINYIQHPNDGLANCCKVPTWLKHTTTFTKQLFVHHRTMFVFYLLFTKETVQFISYCADYLC